MVKLLKKLLKRKPKEEVKPRIIDTDEHNSLGDSIYFTNWDRRRVTGHLKNKPKENDILRCKMVSGRVARFIFVDVEYMNEPGDQFIATVKDYGYESE